MSLFPSFVIDNIETHKKTELKVPSEYEIDYKTGQLTGRMVEGLEAIRVWIWLVLQIPRYQYPIFSWDYGNEYEALIGKSYSAEYLQAEAKRMTEDCLLMNDYIVSIENFTAVLIDEKLNISFVAETKYGEVEIKTNV